MSAFSGLNSHIKRSGPPFWELWHVVAIKKFGQIYASWKGTASARSCTGKWNGRNALWYCVRRKRSGKRTRGWGYLTSEREELGGRKKVKRVPAVWIWYSTYMLHIYNYIYIYDIICIFFILALSLRFPFPKPTFGDSTLHDWWRKAPNGLFHKPILLSGLVRHVCSLYMFILTTWFLIWQVTLPPHMPNTGHGENLPCSISMHGSKQVLETLHWLVPCR